MSITKNQTKLILALSALLLAAGAELINSSPAAASGGLGIPVGDPSGDFARAKLLPNGKARAPSSAPIEVQRAIRAANRIEDKPYCWGGGHGRGSSKCYDCSGSLSYVLKAARLLKRPMVSGRLASWGRSGNGTWITVYAHKGHAFAIIAGLRWDTASVPGSGPGWSKDPVATRGFQNRYWPGL